MRVYDLSKELSIPSKELVALLKQHNFDVKNHMSTVTQEAISFVRAHFKKSESSKEVTEGTMQKQSVKTPPSNQPAARSQNKPYYGKPPVKKEVTPEPVVPKKPVQMVIKPMTVAQAADIVGVSVSDLILQLLQWGVIATINQVLSEETVGRIAKQYEAEIVKPEVRMEPQQRIVAESTGKLESRMPVVVVLGHVDHGKTTLLDYIRKTRVVTKEKGGITQHLGAYEAKTKHGNLVFLDTPGHEAFPKMRQRGIKVADLAILVIAADDGIMPQTLEVIKNLKNMNVPIIVAMNKVDKVEPNRLETVKRQLAEQDLLPEEWGGTVVCMPISALKGTGVDELVEMVALQAQLLELKATKEGHAKCYVLESKIEKGRGSVATLICQQGTLALGDYFVCGDVMGRVSSMTNSYGQTISSTEPSKPVQVAGFKALPEVGDLFRVVDKSELRNFKSSEAQQNSTAMMQAAAQGTVNLIVKTDTNSTKEALVDAISKLSQKSDVFFSIVHAGAGNLNESDVELAYNTGSSIVGLHVKADSAARSLAKRRKVKLSLHEIIYKLLEELEESVQKNKEVEMVRTKIGEARVLKVFDIKGVGVVAGSYISDGRFVKDGYVMAWRGRQKIGEGNITSLQRDKKSVKEVHTGYECGFTVDGITDWREDDRVECYIDKPKV